jgi:hypothetical protein
MKTIPFRAIKPALDKATAAARLIREEKASIVKELTAIVRMHDLGTCRGVLNHARRLSQ